MKGLWLQGEFKLDLPLKTVSYCRYIFEISYIMLIAVKQGVETPSGVSAIEPYLSGGR